MLSCTDIQGWRTSCRFTSDYTICKKSDKGQFRWSETEPYIYCWSCRIITWIIKFTFLSAHDKISLEVIMPRFKENNRKQSIMIPLFLENQLLLGTIEHSIDYLVDNKLYLRPLISDYNNKANGAPAYPPGALLKVLFLAFIRGIYSSTSIPVRIWFSWLYQMI